MTHEMIKNVKAMRKYPDQKILIVDIEGYAYLVPCVVTDEEYFMKTIIPSRKATKRYLGGNYE